MRFYIKHKIRLFLKHIIARIIAIIIQDLKQVYHLQDFRFLIGITIFQLIHNLIIQRLFSVLVNLVGIFATDKIINTTL